MLHGLVVIRFRFGPFPVEFHFSHLLISGFIAYSFVGTPSATSWPRDILADADHPQRAVTLGLVTVGWMLLVSLSVFAHELGHAVAARVFGLKPSIHFVGLGGVTQAQGLPELEWWRQALVTLAGPGAGLLFGVVAGAIALLGGDGLADPVRYFAKGIFMANMWWTVLNLLPISALDGGNLTQLVLTRMLGRPGFLVAQLVALALAAGLLLFAFLVRQPFLGVVVLMLSARTIYNVSAYFRGELPVGSVAHPLTVVIERAEALYRERKLQEAAMLAQGLVEAEATPPMLRSRAHVLLGWVALKQSNGRRALDHYSQVQGFEVPVHALAAAFSLIGDEARAIPLWAQAAHATPEDTILHEYAGALIRGGREAEARALPRVRMALAFSAAERVHYVRKQYDAAATVAEAAFREEPTAQHAYTAACAFALAGKPDDALRLLHLAAQNGYADLDEAERDADLRSLRTRADFAAWLASLKQTPAS